MSELFRLVLLGEPSSLKTALNTALATLATAENTQFRPHVCLNKIEGVGVIENISADPVGANTEFWVSPYPIISGKKIWLNVKLSVFLDQICWPTCVADLTPQQTSYLISNLPPEQQDQMLDKIKLWYHGEFLSDIQSGIESITDQIDNGDILLKSDHDNVVLDLHGGRGMEDIPYSESTIAGEELFWTVVHGGTFLEYGMDGYGRADTIILGIKGRQAHAVNAFLASRRHTDGR